MIHIYAVNMIFLLYYMDSFILFMIIFIFIFLYFWMFEAPGRWTNTHWVYPLEIIFITVIITNFNSFCLFPLIIAVISALRSPCGWWVSGWIVRWAEVWIMPYTYRMSKMVLYSAQYHRQHCIFWTVWGPVFAQLRWQIYDPVRI